MERAQADREATLYAPESGETGAGDESVTSGSGVVFEPNCYGETGPVRVNFQEWAQEIKRRPVESLGAVENPLIRKELE